MTWLIVFAAIAAAEAPAPPQDAPAAFDAFFADFAKKRDAIQTLEARFTQRNVSPEETVNSAGTIVYVNPRRILFRYDRPDAGTTYLIHRGKAYEYEPDIKQLQIYSLEDNPKTEVFFLGFDNNTEALRKGYDVSVFETKDQPVGSRGIAIRPKKNGNEEGHFKEIRLYLRDADYLPYHIHIENDEESAVDIVVTGFAVNGKLDPAKTQIALVEGTKVIENDELIETVGPGGKRVPADEAITVQPIEAPARKEAPAP